MPALAASSGGLPGCRRVAQLRAVRAACKLIESGMPMRWTLARAATENGLTADEIARTIAAAERTVAA